MNKLFVAAGLMALATSAFAVDYYIVQNPRTKVCTITEERPAAGGGIVIGVPFGVRVEAENRMKTVKECTESSTTGSGVTIPDRREDRAHERAHGLGAARSDLRRSRVALAGLDARECRDQRFSAAAVRRNVPGSCARGARSDRRTLAADERLIREPRAQQDK